MPNWCNCSLRVTGDSDALKAFKEFATEGDSCLSANKFIPYPQEYKDKDAEQDIILKQCEEKIANMNTINMTPEMIEAKKLKLMMPYHHHRDGFNSGGYEWCIANWGTKWGICNPYLADDTDWELFYDFDSAWNAPLPVILKMSEMFPTLTFEIHFDEPGCQFQGTTQFKAGIATELMYREGESYIDEWDDEDE